MYITYQKGEIGQLKVQLRAAEKGILVSRPLVEARYDLILDMNGKLLRAQVKYASKTDRRPGGVCVDLRKQTRNVGIKRGYTSEEVDVILVYIPDIDEVLWLDRSVWEGRRSLLLRLDDTRNGRKSGVTLASKYVW